MNIIQKKYILVRDELAVLRQLLYSIFNPKDLIFSSFWFIIPHRCFVNDFLKTKTEIWYYSLIATLDVKVWTFGSSSFVCFFLVGFFFFWHFKSDCPMVRMGADILYSMHYLTCVKWRTLLGHRRGCICKQCLKWGYHYI